MSINLTHTLLVALQNEIVKLQRLQQEIIENQADFAQEPPITSRDLRGIASMLADIFQGAENVFQRIARATNEGLPTGKQWHRQLLNQMSQEIPAVRIPVIQPETHALLEEYRSFRHRDRHNYGFTLVWDKMGPLFATAETTIQLLINDLETFCHFLAQLSSDA